MEIEEYRTAFRAIEKKAKEDTLKLMRSYALSNNTVHVGDIVYDGSIKVKVERIGIYIDPVKPSCVYHGELLTATGKPRKKKKEAAVYQTRIVKGEK